MGDFLRGLGSMVGWKAKSDEPPKREKREFNKLPQTKIMIFKKDNTIPCFSSGEKTPMDEEIKIYGETEDCYVGSYHDNFVDVFFPKDAVRPLSPQEIEVKRLKKDFSGFLTLEDDGELRENPGIFQKIEQIFRNQEKIWIKRSDGSFEIGTIKEIGMGNVVVTWFDKTRNQNLFKHINPADLLEWQNSQGTIN